MARVTGRGLRKAYGATEIIHGLDLDIEDGEFAVLVGPSGCGKSTLLRMIAGLESITGGEIRIGERVVNNLPPGERDIAMVFQSYALYPHKTVRQNMGFALKLRAHRQGRGRGAGRPGGGDPRPRRRYLDRYPRQLSGGQRQRVAMGRAIVRDPQVFLFDEPLSNLDAKLRVQMRAEIKELHQRLKTTTVFVTHDQIEAMTMADKIVVMNAGHIEQVGAPLDALRPAGEPLRRRVHRLAGDEPDPRRRAPGGGGRRPRGMLPLAGRPGRREEGSAVVYGIRPEHLALADDGPAGAGARRRADRRRDHGLSRMRRAGAGGGLPRPPRPRARPGGAARAAGRQGPSLRSGDREEAVRA